jgi:hypothetical protein
MKTNGKHFTSLSFAGKAFRKNTCSDHTVGRMVGAGRPEDSVCTVEDKILSQIPGEFDGPVVAGPDPHEYVQDIAASAGLKIIWQAGG